MLGSGFEKGGPAERWAKRHHADSGVQFVGAVPQAEVLRTLTDDVDVLVHPSLEESFCMSALEAMAIGVPVLGGRGSGAIPWLLEGGKCGRLVNVASPASIASGMRTMLQDKDLRVALARSGRQKALDEYRLDAVAAQYENLLAKSRREQLH
jgi:glycosyltransferase involved in cell wall biosynthesis